MKYILKKALTLIITLFIVSLLAFLAFAIIPGDPTTKILGTEATPEAVEALREELGLNKNVFLRYFDWLIDFVKGDFGISYSYYMSVSDMLADKLPITAMLTVMSFIITLVISIPLGVLLGMITHKAADTTLISVNQVAMSMPAFFIGMLLMYLCGNMMRMFIPGGFVSPEESVVGYNNYMFFPALSIAIPRIAMTVKMLRASIHAEMDKPYVKTAKSRGASRMRILFGHVLKNALIPSITFLAVSAAEIMTGSIIIEQVFTVPGIGRLLLTSISARDFPVVQAIVVILAAWVVIINFVADIVYQLIDPRIRIK